MKGDAFRYWNSAHHHVVGGHGAVGVAERDADKHLHAKHFAHGIACVAYWDISEMLSEGSLVVIDLQDAKPVNLNMRAVLPTRHQVPARVRHLIDALRDKLETIARSAEHSAYMPKP